MAQEHEVARADSSPAVVVRIEDPAIVRGRLRRTLLDELRELARTSGRDDD